MNGDNEVGALRSGMNDSPVLCFESTLTARWIRLDWAGLSWIGLHWARTRLVWVGLGWTSLD